MQITPYVTTESIRAALGVSETELSDSSIEDQMLDLMLLSDLDSTYPEHETLATSATSRDAASTETQKYRLLQIYSLYYCVSEVASNWLAFLKSIDDGNAQVSRAIDFDTLSSLLENAIAKREMWRRRLVAARDGASGPSVPTPSLISISSPATDPVTNS